MINVFRKRYIIEVTSPKVRTSGIDIYYEFLMQLSDKIKMHVLVPPTIVKVPVENAYNKHLSDTNDCGITATMVWLESGVQLHTWPEYSFMTIDIYSCKDFNTDDVDEVLKSFFKPVEFVRKMVV